MQVLRRTSITKIAGGGGSPLANLVAIFTAFVVGLAGLMVEVAAEQRDTTPMGGAGTTAGVYIPVTRDSAVVGSGDNTDTPAPRTSGRPQNDGRPVRVRGLVVPQRRATISAAFTATIASIGPDNGGRFAKGDVLVAFDCGINQAELNRADALAEAARDTLRVRRKMASSGSISKLQVILAQADYKKADADVVVARTRVSYCRILAPFSGRVVRRIANAFETVAPRDPLLEIVDDANIEIRVFVPSLWLKDLDPGATFQFTVDETGETLTVKIIALGASIDNVSQLVEVRGRVVSNSPRHVSVHNPIGAARAAAPEFASQNQFLDSAPLLAGMSGSADFSRPAGLTKAN